MNTKTDPENMEAEERLLSSIFDDPQPTPRVIPFPFSARKRSDTPREWFAIRNKTESSADLFIYDVIDPWFGISAKEVVGQIADLGKLDINLRLNSAGGDVFDGFAIYNALFQYPGKVTVHVDGLAASIVSVIAMAGDEIVMAQNAMIMIHNPWIMSVGTAENLRKDAAILDQIKESIVNTYVSRTDQTREVISKMMDEETYLDADTAIEKGFATSTAKPIKAAACHNLSIYGFAHAPDAVAVPNPTIDPPADEPISEELRAAEERKARSRATLRMFGIS